MITKLDISDMVYREYWKSNYLGVKGQT